MEEKIIERIDQIIRAKKISYNHFDELISAGNGYIGKQIKRNASVGGDVIQKIVREYPDIDVEWLITGNGVMFKSKFSGVSEPELAYMKAERSLIEPYDPNHPPIYQASKDEGFIPYYDIEATASDLHQYHDMAERPDGYIKFPGVEDCDFAVPVYGNSMTPEINSGDYVAVKLLSDLSFINYGVKYLLITEEQRLVKYLHPHPDSADLFVLRSSNKQHNDITIRRSLVLKFYLVCFIFKREM